MRKQTGQTGSASSASASSQPRLEAAAQFHLVLLLLLLLAQGPRGGHWVRGPLHVHGPVHEPECMNQWKDQVGDIGYVVAVMGGSRDVAAS